MRSLMRLRIAERFFYKFVTCYNFLKFDVYLDGFYVYQACRLVPCHCHICWIDILISNSPIMFRTIQLP